MAEPRTHAAGFTLVELMITAAIMGVLVIYLLSAMQTSQQKTVVVEEVTEAQQSLRVIGELLEQDLRHAGFMVPESGAVCGIDSTTGPDTLVVSDSAPISPTTELTANLGARVQGGATNVSVASQTMTVDSLILESPAPPATPPAYYDNDGDGTNDTDFQERGGIIVTDLANPDRGSACGVVDQVTGTTSITFTILSDKLAPVPGSGSTPELVLIPARIYQVSGTRLTRNGMLVASDVEDLQVAYFVDDNENNLVDPDEYKADGAGSSDAFAANAVDITKIREIRANVVTRTSSQEPDNSQGLFQPTENRTGVAGADGFRRRLYTTVVRLRNLGSRNDSLTNGVPST